ncbi:MAG: RNB domain-containing ribonuclease [Betaproteobacteria bacterium]|nr:RNB domain-containing ribonuclease [Betaproteobacteria bacterium]
MFVLFEEDNSCKTGSILAESETSLHIETVSGKRTKVKAANILLRFQQPGAAQLLAVAEPLAGEIEADFLWECVNDGEFSFVDFARDYYGHEASPVEAAAVLLALQAAPIYFHRKGKGRFRKAPADILAAALAGLEKKKQQALAIERMCEALKNGQLPPEFPPLIKSLLYKPDRNRIETKALEAAAAATGKTAAQLLLSCGAFGSAYEYHVQRFLVEYFPHGAEHKPEVEAAAPEPQTVLPRAEVLAFSIDDAATTEIDDAFSVTDLPEGGWRVGIHIAAPGLGILPDSALGAVARERISTVYMPGSKITMLPQAVVERYTLTAGREAPALSLYLTVTPGMEIAARESQLEIVPVVANLRHHEIEPLFNERTAEDIVAAEMASERASERASEAPDGLAIPEFPFRRELALLWRLARHCEGQRGKPAAIQGMRDYSFEIAGDLALPEECRVAIEARPRGSPLDMVVSELMIVANSTWGGLFAEHRVPALYRAQTGGKVRMTTSPLPHEGLGVAQYAWSTSPLRRYTDLLNQWQMISLLQDRTPHFGAKSDFLFSALRDFELTYAAYAEFQRGMERYWCLRWLRQENMSRIPATVHRENLVKLDALPLLLRVPSLPELKPGQRVLLALESWDELTLELDCRYLETLSETVSEDALAEEAVQ